MKSEPYARLAAKAWLRWLGRFLGLLLLAFYFAQHARRAPNPVDGGMMLDYVHRVSHGELPYWDFLDYYGPLTWLFPVPFYIAAGYEAWGVRLWMVVLKTATSVMAYMLARRLGSRFHAMLAVIWVAALFGAPYHFLQIAYPVYFAIPLALGGFYLLAFADPGRRRSSVLLAAVLTVVVLWSKLNAGVFLFAGGLFFLFYWLPSETRASEPRPGDAARETQDPPGRPDEWWLRKAQYLGLAALAVALFSLVASHFKWMYIPYLIVPSALLLVLTWRQVGRCAALGKPFANQLRPWFLYLAATVAGCTLFLFSYFGWPGARLYLAEQVAIFATIDYLYPFPPLGAPGTYVGFNEFYWPQLPWLGTAAFCLWLVLQRRGRGREVFGQQWEAVRSRVIGLFSFLTIFTYIICPPSDEVRLLQSSISFVPLVFILFYQVERLAFPEGGRGRLWARALLFIAVCAAGSTLATVPDGRVFEADRAEWGTDRLRYLRLSEPDGGGVRPFSDDVAPDRWDEAVRWTSWMVDRLTEDESEVLVLSRDRLINYASKTRPAGGRESFLFYLIKNGALDRERLQALAPPGYLDDLIAYPPKVVVSTTPGTPTLVEHLPELGELVRRRFRMVGRFLHITVHLRDDVPLSSEYSLYPPGGAAWPAFAWR